MLAGWLNGKLAGWLTGKLMGWLTGRLTSKLTGWLAGELTGWLAGWILQTVLRGQISNMSDHIWSIRDWGGGGGGGGNLWIIRPSTPTVDAFPTRAAVQSFVNSEQVLLPLSLKTFRFWYKLLLTHSPTVIGFKQQMILVILCSVAHVLSLFQIMQTLYHVQFMQSCWRVQIVMVGVLWHSDCTGGHARRTRRRRWGASSLVAPIPFGPVPSTRMSSHRAWRTPPCPTLPKLLSWSRLWSRTESTPMR